MSYDLYLCDPVTDETLELDAPHDMRGGTYAVGGTTRCHLSITYNYGKHCRILGEKGIRTLYGLTGAESLPLLQAATALLGDDTDPDYWEPTEGNAKQALLQLTALAQLRSDGIWRGD